MCILCGNPSHHVGIGGGASTSGGAATSSGSTSGPAPQSYVNALLSPMPANISQWNDSSSRSAPLEFTYTFETSQPADQWNLFTGWTAFTAAQKNAVKAALAEIASMINVSFTEVGQFAANPDINLGRVNLSPGLNGQGGFKYTYVTDGYGNITARSLDGFAVFNKTVPTLSPNLILHELGHALTLKHPGTYGSGDGGAPGPFLPAGLDNNKYSVMSYVANPDNGMRSNHLMLYDIAALQHRFGANHTTRTGNNVYTGPQGQIQAIWDAGGIDRIDGSKYKTALTIDLREGHFSSLGKHHNLAIAYGVKIENATGGTAKDLITGNPTANSLVGSGGRDTLKGLGGPDSLDGGPGSDILTGNAGADSFIFRSALNASTNVDRITDFNPAADTIRLSHGVFTALSTGYLNADAFRVGASAADAEDRIIYNAGNGALSYDSNGNLAGGMVRFATLPAHLSMTSADFFVF